MQASPVPPPSLLRRKKEHRRGITYTLLLCGNAGTGKTTFANNLLESNIFPHKFNNSDYMENSKLISDRIKIISPTKVVSFNSKNGIPSFMAEFDPDRSALESGITTVSYTHLDVYKRQHLYKGNLSKPTKLPNIFIFILLLKFVMFNLT